MPIANCYINQISVSTQQLETLTKEWANSIDVDLKDICLSFINVSNQTGQNYNVMVNLFLPTIWDKSSIERIQINLDKALKKNLNLKNKDVFIITSIVQSGNVVENGQVVNWND
jgi:translation elongation factor EF-1alpha